MSRLFVYHSSFLLLNLLSERSNQGPSEAPRKLYFYSSVKFFFSEKRYLAILFSCDLLIARFHALAQILLFHREKKLKFSEAKLYMLNSTAFAQILLRQNAIFYQIY